MDEQTQYIILY